MALLPITLAVWDYDRTTPIASGRVGIEGCAVDCLILPPQETFVRAFATAEFDVSELSLSRQAQAIANGTAQYAALPIFPSRSFRHGSIFIRSDRGIAHPRDLVGRKIGLRNFDDTAAVVVRGLLRDQYGLGRGDITWVTGDFSRPEREIIPRPPVPADVPIEILPYGAILDGSLAAGEIDGMIGLVPPPCFLRGDGKVRRLFPDWRTAEQAYFAQTRLFPIMHVLGVRQTLLDANPWLAGSISAAFEAAKARAMADLAMMQAPKSSLPWTVAEFEATRALMGEDFWAYGVAPNRAVIETTLRHLNEDGLLARPVTAEELFKTT